MRYLFMILFLSVAAPTAFATNTYDAAVYTCEELNQILDEEGRIIINYRGLGASYHHAARDMCARGYIPYMNSFKAADGWCRAGFKCKPDNRGGRR